MGALPQSSTLGAGPPGKLNCVGGSSLYSHLLIVLVHVRRHPAIRILLVELRMIIRNGGNHLETHKDLKVRVHRVAREEGGSLVVLHGKRTVRECKHSRILKWTRRKRKR